MDTKTNFRWVICAMLFMATAVNYLDRQVLSLTWDEFIKPEFHWDESHYGTITSIFSIVYAVCMLFAGKFVDWMGTRKGYLWAIGIWSAGACAHALCGVVTESIVGLHNSTEMIQAVGDTAVLISTVSMYCFLVARSILALGEAGNFPAAIKTTAEYFPKKDILAKFSESAISCIDRLVDFSCDLASIITMREIISMHVFPVDCFTVVHRCACVIFIFSA